MNIAKRYPKGSIWLYDSYILKRESGEFGYSNTEIIETGTKVMKIKDHGASSIGGTDIKSNSIVYISYDRLVEEMTKEEHPEYYL